MQEFLVSNKGEIWTLVLAIIVFLTVQILKQPIKLLTNKITNERTRKIANFTIFLLPFGLGILAQFIFCIIDKVPFSINAGLIVGMTSVTFYGVIERFLSSKRIENPYKSADGQALLSAMQVGLQDRKLDKDDLYKVAETLAKAIESPLKKVDSDEKENVEPKKNSAVDDFIKYIKQGRNNE